MKERRRKKQAIFSHISSSFSFILKSNHVECYKIGCKNRIARLHNSRLTGETGQALASK
jgi:hypothetical protein